MPTTATGTAYTVHSHAVSGHGTCYWGVADTVAGDPNVPTLVYAHGSGGAPNNFATATQWTAMRDAVIDAGMAWVEGGGGDTDAAGAEGWGNQDARDAYEAYVAYLKTQIDVGDIVVMGRSMGGLVAVWLFLLSTFEAETVGLIVNSGVQTLTYGTYPDANRDNWPSGYHFSPKIRNAFGSADYTEFVTDSADFDPMGYDVDLWDGKNVLQLVGDADTSVPPQSRGAYPLRAVYEGHPAIDQLYIRPGGDHTASNGLYLEVPTMMNFIYDVAGITPPVTPVDPVIYRRIAKYRITGGKYYELTPRKA